MTNKEAIKRIHRFVETYKICGKDNYNPATNITKLDYEAFKTAIESLERPQGEWIDDSKEDSYYANCSHCNYQIDTHYERGYLNYCPNCGAKMQEVEE